MAVIVALVLVGGGSGSSPVAGAANAPGSAIWHDVGEQSLPSQARASRQVVPSRYRTLAADLVALDAALAAAPVEGSAGAKSAPATLELPLPDGSLGAFRIVQSPVMEPGLAARYPQITTYMARGVDDPTATARLDRTPHGFHAMVLSASGTWFVDPYSRSDTTYYVSYRKQDYALPSGKTYAEMEDPQEAMSHGYAPGTPTGRNPAGAILRTYRLAVAATGEYTQFQGGTKADAMSAIVTTVNRVDGVYEREVAVRMVLVANDDSVVYVDPSTDPYTNNDGVTMLSQNQTNLDAVIGSANYDIGHVFSTGGGGLAYLGAVCAYTNKARGVTGSSKPVGDPFDIDYVAHEMGHQFGANHTFNGTTAACGGGNRNAPTAYEPASGSTIMAYAGICNDSSTNTNENLQPHSDDYFHTASFDEIMSYITGGTGASCGVTTATGNTPPSVNAGLGYTVPANTPFKLTGTASDPNGDALTYNWEEYDLGSASPPETDNGSRPIFRSWPASTSPTRYFPLLQDVLNGTSTFGEWLPSTNRTMQFRLTVRDNRVGGGGVDYAQMGVTVSASAGPFRVTAPSGQATWTTGTQQTVAWDVANTDVPPISCSKVNILLSTDGGQTFATMLAAGTPNDGSETLSVPYNATSQARVQVACAGNIFYNVSDSNFTILSDGTTPTETPTSTGDTPTPTSTAGTSACNITFADVPPDSTYYSFVQCMACHNIVGGYACGGPGEPCGSAMEPYFRPGANVMRGQIAKMVALARDFSGPTGSQKFEDVAPSSPFYDSIQQLAVRGYIGGYTCGSNVEPCRPGNLPYFRPGAVTTRGQLAKIVSEAAGFTDDPGEQIYADVAPADPFYPWINRLTSRYIVSGYQCGGPGEPCDTWQRPYFRPNALVTRGQTAKITSNTFFPSCSTP